MKIEQSCKKTEQAKPETYRDFVGKIYRRRSDGHIVTYSVRVNLYVDRVDLTDNTVDGAGTLATTYPTRHADDYIELPNARLVLE